MGGCQVSQCARGDKVGHFKIKQRVVKDCKLCVKPDGCILTLDLLKALQSNNHLLLAFLYQHSHLTQVSVCLSTWRGNKEVMGKEGMCECECVCVCGREGGHYLRKP